MIPPPPPFRMWHTWELATSRFCCVKTNLENWSPASVLPPHPSSLLPQTRPHTLLWNFALFLECKADVNILLTKTDFLYTETRGGSREWREIQKIIIIIMETRLQISLKKKKALGCCGDMFLCCPTFIFLFLASLNINSLCIWELNAGSRTTAEKRHLTNEGFLCNIYFLNLHFDLPENKFKLIFAFALFPFPPLSLSSLDVLFCIVNWILIYCLEDWSYTLYYICLQYISVVHIKTKEAFFFLFFFFAFIYKHKCSACLQGLKLREPTVLPSCNNTEIKWNLT